MPLLYVTAILWLCLYICREALSLPSAERWFSMHGEWLSIARLAGTDWFRPHWFRWQGGGAPLEFLYAPLVPFVLALGDGPRLLNALTAFVYAVGPALLFLALWRLLRSPWPALAAAVFYALFSPTELFLPDGDWKPHMFLSARRFYLLWEWDELPHAMAVMLMPVLGWLLLRGRFISSVVCAAFMMLGSVFGLVLSALVALTVMLCTRRIAWAPAVAWLIVSPWLPPSLLWTIRANSVLNAEVPPEAKPAVALLAVVASTGVVWFLTRRLDPARRWLALIACPMLLIPILFQRAGLYFLPQAGRYKVEAELAVAMLLGLILHALFRRAPRWLSIAAIIPLVWFGSQQVIEHRRFAKRVLTTPPAAAARIERTAAEWIATNLPGKRVMLSGSMAVWGNAFTNIEQIGGISYPTVPNFRQQLTMNEVHWGADPAPAIAALRRFGVGAVVVPGPKSPEFWHPYSKPAKFEGGLPVLWREQETTIYAVPDAAPHPRWLDDNHARILAAGKVSLPVNAMPGWHASRGSLKADDFGLMQLDTGCTEPCTVDLTYTGSAEQWLCRAVSLLTLLALAWKAWS